MVKFLIYRFSKLSDFNVENNKAKYEIQKMSVKTLFENRYITSQECLKVLVQLNPNKTQGPSKILYRVLRDRAVHLSQPLNFLFNEYLKILQFLSSLKKAKITPLFKKR